MELPILKNLLFASSIVMYTYGLLSLLGSSPQGEEYRSYRIARKIFGSYMFFIATCLLIHLLFDLRGQNPLLATSLCVIYVNIGTMILSVVLSSLIQRDYPFGKRLKEIALCALGLGGMFAINCLFVPKAQQNIALMLGAFFFMFIVIVISVRFYRMYRNAINRANNYYSDNVGKFVKWIPIALYNTIILVMAGVILPFLSQISLIILYLLLGLLLYTHILISLQSYVINISKMKMLLLTTEQNDTASENLEQQIKSNPIEVESCESKAVKLKLEGWIEEKGFTKQGLTLDDLAGELNTNRTYLSSYINVVYNLTFRGWVASQRIEYSKELLLQNEELSSAVIADMVGYSPNAFIKIFTKTEGVPPVQWKKKNNR